MDPRDRVYERYVHARTTALAPETVGQLSSRAPYLRALIRSHFPASRSSNLLDLGCGHGALIYFAREAGYANIAGVDRSPEQVAEAARLGIPGVRLGDSVDALRELPPESLDAVIAFDVVEHLTKAELVVLIDEVLRVLRPSAPWIIHAPNAESPFFGRIRYGDITHEQAFTRVSIAQLLLASGFHEVASYEDLPVVHGAKSAARFLIWKISRGLLRLYLAAETGSTDPRVILTQNFLTVARR